MVQKTIGLMIKIGQQIQLVKEIVLYGKKEHYIQDKRK